MNRPDLFDLASGALIRAYLNGTLDAGRCAACACGNIAAAALGRRVFYDARVGDYRWENASLKHREWFWQAARARNGIGQDALSDTGYTAIETAKVEDAFMDAAAGGDNYAGLLAVIDVLYTLHEIEDEAPRTAFVASLTPEAVCA